MAPVMRPQGSAVEEAEEMFAAACLQLITWNEAASEKLLLDDGGHVPTLNATKATSPPPSGWKNDPSPRRRWSRVRLGSTNDHSVTIIL